MSKTKVMSEEVLEPTTIKLRVPNPNWEVNTQDGKYVAVDGILEVPKELADILLLDTDYTVVVG